MTATESTNFVLVNIVVEALGVFEPFLRVDRQTQPLIPGLITTKPAGKSRNLDPAPRAGKRPISDFTSKATIAFGNYLLPSISAEIPAADRHFLRRGAGWKILISGNARHHMILF
jgi:hypothetical protein